MFPGSKIYGGLRGAFDYGPLGGQLKKNISDLWWRDFVEQRRDCVGLDSSIILHPQVWHTSKHVEEFTDPMTECPSCHSRSRADHLLEKEGGMPPAAVAELSMEDMGTELAKRGINCPSCQTPLPNPRQFNLLFQTSVGPTAEDGRVDNTAYLRPETAQGAYVNFSQIVSSTRRRIPFGVGQIGKAFRNEIHPGHFLFRTREFELLELQYFCHPNETKDAYNYWRLFCKDWLLRHGVRDENVRIRDYGKGEVAHYANATADIEYNFPSLGWSEVWGIADRGNFDLTQHIAGCGGDKKVGQYTDPSTQERYVPHIIEPALGLNRAMLTFLADAYDEEEIVGKNGKREQRIVLRLHEDIAPYKCAVLPLMKKDGLAEMAEDLHESMLRQNHGAIDFDMTGSIGKRYRRQDEIGTPLCITVDHQTLENGSVTVRCRDTLKQTRVDQDDLNAGWVALLERVRMADSEPVWNRRSRL